MKLIIMIREKFWKKNFHVMSRFWCMTSFRDVILSFFANFTTYWRFKPWDLFFRKSSTWLKLLSIWGVVPPPNRKKNREKDRQMQSRWFFTSVTKFSWATFKTIFEILSALVACHVIIIGGVVYKKSMIFKVFWVYLSFWYSFILLW